MLKIRFFIKLSLQFHHIKLGNQRTKISSAILLLDQIKGGKKESDSRRHDFWIVRDPQSVLARHDATWQSLCPGRYEDVVEQTPPRRRAKCLQNVYAYHGSAYTSTPLALSDGTDIRLRCQPIVKGTIRRAGDGSAANHFHPSPSASSFSFLFLFIPLPLSRLANSSNPRPFIPFLKLQRWRGRHFFVIISSNDWM